MPTAVRPWRRVARNDPGLRRTSRYAVSSPAASRKRAPAVSSAGRLSTTYRIAR